MSKHIDSNIASHIAYLINKMECAAMSMREGSCEVVSYSEHQASWALCLIRLGEYGIELPNLDFAKESWVAASDKERFHAEATVRALSFHTALEAA